MLLKTSTILPPEIEVSSGDTSSVKITASVRFSGEDQIYSFRVKGGKEGVVLRFLRPIVLELESTVPLDQVRFFLNGYSSFSGTGSFHLEEEEIDTLLPALRQVHRNFHLPKGKEKGELTSSLFACLHNGEEEITLGFLNDGEYFTQIKTRIVNGKIRLYIQLQMDDRLLSPGETLKIPDLFMSSGSSAEALERYADLLHGVLNVKSRPVPPGWCTWYHYFTKIDEKEFLKNLDLARNLRPSIKIFQLDDGYQAGLGDWLNTNAKFPSGLKYLAEKTKEAGFIPGIWTAPFLGLKSALPLKEKPEWILRNQKGEEVLAMWNPNWALFSAPRAIDISRPDFKEHIRNVYTTLYDWGFRFFKLDFLYSACLPGNYFEKKTSIRILRDALQMIRDIVKDSYILGCGCPFEAGIGIVDSMRVGNDITPYWSNYIDSIIGGGFEQLSTKNSIRNTIARSFMHDRWFQNDPDCIITRRVKNNLTETEMRTLGQVNALSGGPLMISDDLAALDEKSRSLLESIFSIQKAFPEGPLRHFSPDILEHRMPVIQVVQGRKEALVGIYNFEEHPRDLTLDVEQATGWRKAKVTDFYSGERREGVVGKVYLGQVEKHGSRLLRIQSM